MPASPGSKIGFNVAVGDDDDGDPINEYAQPFDTYLAWDGNRPQWEHFREEDWGTLTLVP